MEAKLFKSRLFKRKIEPDNPDYWTILYADVLFRIREIDDLNCFCEHCAANLKKLNDIIADMEKDEHIDENHKPRNFTGQGFCKKVLEEDERIRAEVYKKTR